MVRSARKDDTPFQLYYAVNNLNDALFVDEIKEGFISVSERGERIDFTAIASENSLEADYFICGPPTFIDDGVEQLTQMGIQNLHFERWW